MRLPLAGRGQRKFVILVALALLIWHSLKSNKFKLQPSELAEKDGSKKCLERQ